MKVGELLLIGGIMIIVFIGVFIASQEEPKPIPDLKRIAIEKWSDNQLLDSSYRRYTEVFSKLKYDSDRQSLIRQPKRVEMPPKR